MSDNGETPMHKAAYFNNLAAARLLPAHGANVNANRVDPYSNAGAPLHSASVNGDYKEMAALLLEHGANVNATSARGQTALQLAKVRGNKEVSKLLASLGAQ